MNLLIFLDYQESVKI